VEATLNQQLAEFRPPHRPAFAEAVAIREASLADSRAIDALATLDSSRRPHGRLLVAEVDGDIVAALPIQGGRAIADPFRHTSEAVALLEARAAQLRGRRRRRAPLLRPRLV
jgi:hypothetical protein